MIKFVYLYIAGNIFFIYLIIYFINYDTICVSLYRGKYFFYIFNHRISESWELKYGFALLNLFLLEWCNALQIIIMLSRNNCGIHMEFIQILILNTVQYFIFRIEVRCEEAKCLYS